MPRPGRQSHPTAAGINRLLKVHGKTSIPLLENGILISIAIEPGTL